MKIKNDNFPLKVIIKELYSNPRCPHGPTILFARQHKKYFACSAYRNRKSCDFYMLESDHRTGNNIRRNNSINDKKVDHQFLYNEFIKMKFSQTRCYCHSCNVLFDPTKEKKHSDHDFISDLSLRSLFHPSEFLKPMDDNKKEAQYLFSKNSVNTIVNIVKRNRYRRLICIGTPRIHEYIKENGYDLNMSSILLDMDERHYNFNAPHEFCRYNMFNDYFFDGKSAEDAFSEFLRCCKEEDVCIIMDPPFGGRIEPLANTLREIRRKFNGSKISIIFVMPYFMEPHINNYMPELKMSDYRVCYDNHVNFRNDSKQKIGSPVRFFTNIQMKDFILPVDEGYKFCENCTKWVGEWNVHCVKCNDCTGKNGTAYMHCDECDRCVKSSWSHCIKCDRCALRNHICVELENNQECFNCQRIGHKKNNCPKLKKSEDWSDTIKQ